MEIILKEIRRETPTTMSFIFDKPVGFDFQPGQFAQWAFPVEMCDERCNKRPFSIATSPTEDYLMMTTRRGVSALKKAMETFSPGISIQAVGPLGRFVLTEDSSTILMIAGGIGITPLRSMIKNALDKKTNHQITLLYFNKSVDEIIYQNELQEWMKQSEKITIIEILTDETNIPPDWQGRVGRVTEQMIQEFLTPEIQVFTCGPKPMVDAIRLMLKTIGFPEEKVHREDFSGY